MGPHNEETVEPEASRKSLCEFTIHDVNVEEESPPDLLVEAFDQLVGWANGGNRFSVSDFNLKVFHESYPLPLAGQGSRWRIRLHLATNNNIYHISVVMHVGDLKLSQLYLGAAATSRRPRTGESWHRGNDLADGKFSFGLWNKILADIVAYELVKHQSDAWKKQ